MRGNSKKFVERIALERICRLFELAEEEFAKHPERSNRYVELARRMSSRNKVGIPDEFKKRFCKKCGAFLVEGKNAVFEEEGELLGVLCKECGNVRKLGKE